MPLIQVMCKSMRINKIIGMNPGAQLRTFSGVFVRNTAGADEGIPGQAGDDWRFPVGAGNDEQVGNDEKKIPSAKNQSLVL